MFNAKERDFLLSIGLGFDFDNLSEDELVEIEDVVSVKLQTSGLSENGSINKIGVICESILDQLA